MSKTKLSYSTRSRVCVHVDDSNTDNTNGYRQGVSRTALKILAARRYFLPPRTARYIPEHSTSMLSDMMDMSLSSEQAPETRSKGNQHFPVHRFPKYFEPLKGIREWRHEETSQYEPCPNTNTWLLMLDERVDRVDDNTMIRKKLGADLSKVAHLPAHSPPGLIPINSKNERLDIYMRAPNRKEWAAYHAQAQLKRPCGFYHLGHACNITPCAYDHKALGPDALYCVQFLMKNIPCGDGSNCRKLDCIKGHLCQRDGCLGDSEECRMKKVMHKSDLRVFKCVKPVVDNVSEESASVPSIDDFLIDF